MSHFSPLRLLILGWLILLLSVLPATGGPEKLNGPEKSEHLEASVDLPEALPKVLAEGAVATEKQISDLNSRVAATGEILAETRINLKELQVAVAFIKATLAVKKLPLSQVQDLRESYGNREGEVKARSKELAQEIEELKKTQELEIVAQNNLRRQIDIIQTTQPEALTLELQQSYLNYLKLADTRDRLAGRVLDNLEQRRQLLEIQRELLAGLQLQLKGLEQSWQVEFLKRPAEKVSLLEQVSRAWRDMAVLPGRAWDWLTDLMASGRLHAFFLNNLTHMVGLLIYIFLLGWGTRRLNRLVTDRFQAWRTRAGDLNLLSLFILGHILISNLFLLGLILWLGLFLWIFGMLTSLSAQLVLDALIALWGLRLGLQSVQVFFAGKAAAGVLPLDPSTARFYRRSLKVFLVYLFLGVLGLKSADLLDVPEASLQFIKHFFQLGIFFWVLWFWRRPHLARLLPGLPDPAWVRRMEVMQVIRGLVLFLLAIIILADLLGFYNLAYYLAGGATWTWLAIILLWFLWLAAETILHYVLHPETGWALRRYPKQQEMWQRVLSFGRWVLSIVLGVAVGLWFLATWGINPQRVVWAFQWLTWGPTLGPVKLTALNVGVTVLTLYLGLWISRLIRSLMNIRIFPRTGWDTGVQYTISTTLHYVILILAGMIALNILGLPLTNLALVVGALGVGIGFGLQNIVNNFISGLILLVERPIKVGDMLVIDGQWGLVKEIRVRSTVFETFDRYVLIIPNSELLSSKVLNWTHYGAGINRLTLKVGVSYGSDVRRVTQLLTEICQANPRVVTEPPPQIYFAVYGDSSLDFTIWVHLRTPSDRIPATHELNSAIFEAFQEHGIEIPFPQRDLHIKDWPGTLEKKGE